MRKWLLSLLIAASSALLPQGDGRAAGYGNSASADALVSLIDARPDLRGALDDSLRKADWNGIVTIDAFIRYVNDTSRLIPTNRDIFAQLIAFNYMINHSKALRESAEFQDWAKHFVASYGDFLDTTESVAGLSTFYADPAYRIADFYPGPSGWLTFNQFFGRYVKPGKRPIAGLHDRATIVSPGDGIFKGVFPIGEDSTIVVKGFRYGIKDLLKGSAFADRFAGGIFIHSFQELIDYHHFHVPFDGEVMESKVIPGYLYVDIVKLPDGTLNSTGGTGFQFRQERGLLTLKTAELGMVAVLPIGMGHVGSVRMTPDVGARLHKGEEFGFFQFGGSDVIVLFEKGRAEIDAVVGRRYRQGEAIGRVSAPSR